MPRQQLRSPVLDWCLPTGKLGQSFQLGTVITSSIMQAAEFWKSPRLLPGRSSWWIWRLPNQGTSHLHVQAPLSRTGAQWPTCVGQYPEPHTAFQYPWQTGGPCAVFSPGFEPDAWNARIWKQLASVQKKKIEVKGLEWLACVGTDNHGSRLGFQC